MAFRKKADIILKYNPDILIIQECEHPDKIRFNEHIRKPLDVIWIGDNKNKGLGIFSYSNFRFKLHKTYNPKFKLIAPIKVSNGIRSFILYAVWANNPHDKDGQYITQKWKALDYYKKLIRKKNTMLVGDFNSNTIWDKPRRQGNHTTVVRNLEKKGIHSSYHKYFQQEQGKELHPTLYLHRNIKKPYHIDYCFTSSDFLKNLLSVEISNSEFWLKYSDHVPVITTFKTVN